MRITKTVVKNIIRLGAIMGNAVILHFMRARCLYLLIFILLCTGAKAQLVLSGTVYDSTKIYSLSGVKILSTSGNIAYSDSIGAYSINVTRDDSVYFIYRNKPTAKFAVKSILTSATFDISLKVHQTEKYKPLPEVVVYGRTYREDSLENRITYAKTFNFSKPGLQMVTPSGMPGAAVGFDLDQLINIFKFRRNKLNSLFQKTLIEIEHDRYVRYRFNSLLLKRITGLQGAQLEKYKKEYEPDYEFVSEASQLEFYEYILKTAEIFKAQAAK